MPRAPRATVQTLLSTIESPHVDAVVIEWDWRGLEAVLDLWYGGAAARPEQHARFRLVRVRDPDARRRDREHGGPAFAHVLQDHYDCEPHELVFAYPVLPENFEQHLEALECTSGSVGLVLSGEGIGVEFSGRWQSLGVQSQTHDLSLGGLVMAALAAAPPRALPELLELLATQYSAPFVRDTVEHGVWVPGGRRRPLRLDRDSLTALLQSRDATVRAAALAATHHLESGAALPPRQGR